MCCKTQNISNEHKIIIFVSNEIITTFTSQTKIASDGKRKSIGKARRTYEPRDQRAVCLT